MPRKDRVKGASQRQSEGLLRAPVVIVGRSPLSLRAEGEAIPVGAQDDIIKGIGAGLIIEIASGLASLAKTE